MANPFNRVSSQAIYGKPSYYEPKRAIPTEPEVKTYDPLKSLIDSKFNRITLRRIRNGKSTQA